MLQNNNEVFQDFLMHGFNRLEWKGTEGYKTHTHTQNSSWYCNSEHEIHMFEYRCE